MIRQGSFADNPVRSLDPQQRKRRKQENEETTLRHTCPSGPKCKLQISSLSYLSAHLKKEVDDNSEERIFKRDG